MKEFLRCVDVNLVQQKNMPHMQRNMLRQEIKKFKIKRKENEKFF